MVERQAEARIRTTEWEDIQYKHGNRVGKYRDNEMEILAQKLADANPNIQLRAYDPVAEKVKEKMERGGYDVDTNDVEDMVDKDDMGDDDDDALAVFRQRRMAEMQKLKETHVFGVVTHVPGSDYIKEVTEGSAKSWVVAILTMLGNEDSENLLQIMRQVASRNRDVRFVSMIAQEAIPKFPAKHVPCVLLYKDGVMQQQTTGLEQWQERKEVTLASVEKALQGFGVIHREEYVRDDEEDRDDDLRMRMAYKTGDVLRKK